MLMQLLANPDPQLQADFGASGKSGVDQAADRARGIVIPDEESRTKQFREIAQLGGGAADFASSIRKRAAEMMLPSVLPDAFADNHAVELETCKRWFSSRFGAGG